MTFAPIRTERLLLRPVRVSDADALVARRSDPEVARLQAWTAPYPSERAQEIVRAAAATDRPHDDEWWMLTVADRGDTTILGDLAIRGGWNLRSFEIGYTFASSVWGNGYAVEAVAALVARLFADPRVGRVHAMLHPDNVASAQVLERTGFLFEGLSRGSFWVGDDNSDDALYGMIRDDWDTWRERPRTPPTDVRLVEITPGRLGRVRELATHRSQERFVGPLSKWFAEAVVPPDLGGEPAVPWLRAIEADGDLVGVVMLSLPTERHPEPYLWRLMIDRLHQRRGIGGRVVGLVVDHCRELGADSLLVTWGVGRGSPEPMYLGRGFVPTGAHEGDEVQARLKLG